jgi:ribosomal protein L37AE/L43A
MKACAVCGASLEGRRPQAIYCCDGCRSAGRDDERAARRLDPDRPPCPVCGESMVGRRDGAVYCSPSCRATAWAAAHADGTEGDHTRGADRRVQKRKQSTVGSKE